MDNKRLKYNADYIACFRGSCRTVRVETGEGGGNGVISLVGEKTHNINQYE